MILTFYILIIIAFLIATAALYMPMNEIFPIKWQYYHYFIRKPINRTIFVVIVTWTGINAYQQGVFPISAIAPLILVTFAMILTYRLHQEVVFKAVDYPSMTKDITSLPLEDNMQVAVIEYNGITKSYPLDYVIHHHIVNDKFGDKLVSLTYCAMCRSIIPFDVTEIGPLFVGSYCNGNMIVADRKTKTFFQQASFESVIGKLHPSSLNMIAFQILNWSELKELMPNIEIVKVTKNDLREFELPVPGAWKKIMNSDIVPGLSKKSRDTTFRTRTSVIGIFDKSVTKNLVYLKSEVLNKSIVINKEQNFFLIGVDNTVNGFKTPVNNPKFNIEIKNNQIHEINTKTIWNLRGKYISGDNKADLELLALSDEYWFSWQKYHKDSDLIRL